jgi:hypothetical protein
MSFLNRTFNIWVHYELTNVQVNSNVLQKITFNNVDIHYLITFKGPTISLEGGGGGLWFFVSFRIFFSDNTRVRIFFFCRAKREFFFQNLSLGYMTKTLNHIIFFFSTKIRIFFLEKNHSPPSS